MGYHLVTARGYDFFEVASALQKEIRRGNEEAALYWALELGSKFDDFLWSRLSIIASEDIGPADNSIAVLIYASFLEGLKDINDFSAVLHVCINGLEFLEIFQALETLVPQGLDIGLIFLLGLFLWYL